LASAKGSSERIETLTKWKKTGGLLVMGYQLFRILVCYNGKSKKVKESYDTCLIDPGSLMAINGDHS
jgi:hypothetical protein